MTIKLVASEGLTHGPWPHVPGLLWGRASVETSMFGRERRTLKQQQQQQTLLYWPRKQERRLRLSQSDMNGRRGMAGHGYDPNAYVAETGRFAQVLGANLGNMWDPSQEKRKSRETERGLTDSEVSSTGSCTEWTLGSTSGTILGGSGNFRK